MTRFEAPWSRTLRATTALALVLLLGGAVGLLLAAPAFDRANPLGPAVVLVPGALLVATALLTWALAPRGFALEAGQLRIERPLAPIAIPLASIRTVERVSAPGLRGVTRLGGTSGLFGYYGRFWSRALGPFRMYATRMDGLVLVDSERGRFVLSPDPPDAFVDALLARAHRAERRLPAPGAAPGKGGGRAVLAMVLAPLVGVLALVGLITWQVHRTAPARIELGPDAVIIERQAVSPLEIPLSTIRHVEPLPPAAMRGLRKVSGARLGEVRYGRFRTPALGTFRLFATHPGPYVLLETDEGRVVVTPEDPAAFAEGLRARIPG